MHRRIVPYIKMALKSENMAMRNIGEECLVGVREIEVVHPQRRGRRPGK